MEQKLPKRSEVAVEQTWKLEDVYPDVQAFEEDLKRGLALADEIAGYEGKLGDGAEVLLKVYELYQECKKTDYRFFGYAMMRSDVDTGNADNLALLQKAQSADVKILEKTAFIEPEVLALGEEKMNAYYESCPALRAFQITIDDAIRLAPHTLNKSEEKLLAAANIMALAPYQSFSMLQNADMKFPTVKDGDEEVQITNGRFTLLEASPNRELRKEVFEQYYGTYKSFRNTIASLYDAQMKQLFFFAKARGYKSSFEAAVGRDNVSPQVCERLLSSVHKNIAPFHRYMALRKKMLGVDELHMYDVYANMLKDYERSVTYEEAKEMLLEGLAPLGDHYLALLREAFENRWIDAVENEGKRVGAYCNSVYATHPFVLMNFNNTFEDAFVLAHELGHAMHFWHSDHSHDFFNAQYKMFVAEVASITNEVLLNHYLIGKAASREEKAYLINHLLDSFKGTLFRQAMLEEFEIESNRMSEQGVPITADSLSELYLRLNKEYYGPAMISDPLIGEEWSRVPHMYMNFYCYQYATSFAASVAVAKRILTEGEHALKDYIRFLSAGCTDDPVSILKIAGVDLSTEKPVEDAMKYFDELLTQLEELAE